MNSEKLVEEIGTSWNEFQQEVLNYCETLGKKAPKIIAVSKTRTIEEINAAWDCGIRSFGENYAKELVIKAEILPQAEWHYIGRLQRRNVKQLIPHVSNIHSLTSVKLENRLSKLNYQGKCLLQINISGENTKSGISMDNGEVQTLLNKAKTLDLDVTGFMAMGSFYWNHSEIIEGFNNFISFIQKFNLPDISLGMSGDWKEAIQAGSTMLRIGTRIFGNR